MQIRNYNQFGGQHHESAALRNILAHWGVTAPHTGQPLSEPLLFGIAGGIAATYYFSSITPQPRFAPIWRNMGNFAEVVCDKLHLTTHVSETSSNKVAERDLKAFLEGGDPVIVWGDMASMPYHALPDEWIRFFRHVFVVYGYDDASDQFMIADRASVPLTITSAELQASRRAIGYFKRRGQVIEPVDEIEGLPAAVISGIRVVCQSIIAPKGAGHSGLNGLQRWADSLVNHRNKRSWPLMLAARGPLFDSLCSIYYFGEMRGTGGGAYRNMYADFLDEAAVITNKPGLHDAAELYRAAAQAWRTLDEAALPDDIAPLAGARSLIAQRTALYEQYGAARLDEMNAITERLWQLRTELDREASPTSPEVDALLANLRDHVLRVHDAEKEAAELLALLVGW